MLSDSWMSNPVEMSFTPYSGGATHNCWLNDDGNYLFTTDEVAVGVTAEQETTRYSVRGAVSYRLTDPATGQSVHVRRFEQLALVAIGADGLAGEIIAEDEDDVRCLRGVSERGEC